MLNSNSNIGDQTAAAEVVPSKDRPKDENYEEDKYQEDDDSDQLNEDNNYLKAYRTEQELLEKDRATSEQLPYSATLRQQLWPVEDPLTTREVDQLLADFGVSEELKEEKRLYLRKKRLDKLMLTENVEEEDASFINGAKNYKLIMDGTEKSSAGPPEKTLGE